MTSHNTAPVAVIRNRLSQNGPLGPEAEAMVASLPQLGRVKVGVALMRDRTHPVFMGSGWGARFRWLKDGRRQIISFLLPGDPVGLGRHGAAEDAAIALTPVYLVDAQPVQAALADPDPRWERLRRAVHDEQVAERDRLISTIVRLGRQTAYERMCHLLLELGERIAATGLGDQNQFPLPLTQEMIADASGLSVVHVNRTLQQLRRDRLLELRAGHVRILNRAEMLSVSEYQRSRDEVSRL